MDNNNSNNSSGFKLIDIKTPKIQNQSIGTLAPGMSLKLFISFRAVDNKLED